jgi:hypothetical protein
VSYYQEPLHHLARLEIADRGAISAVSAPLHIGLFHQVAPVADTILWVFEISTTIVATETDPVGFGKVASVAERSADQMFFAGFLKYFFHLRPAYLLETGATGSGITPKYEADISSRTFATLATLPASAIAHPESVVFCSHLPGFLPGGDIMKMELSFAH